MRAEKQIHIFGPIPSRRLGLSLGVDIVPLKTCSFNCVYCQLGLTAQTTLERRSYVSVSDIMDQLKDRLPDEPHLDYITFSGSGEPTLNSDIGDIISAIKTHTSIPVAVLTNGSLLWDTRVQADLLNADLVVPSLDAGTPEVFQRINRPHPELDLERIIRGLVEFRRVYHGQIWLEIFLLKDVNTMESELLKIREYAEAICPDRIQINTIARPPAEDSAEKVPYEDLTEIQALFGERAEVIAPYGKAPTAPKSDAQPEEILAMLGRRSCTVEDIATGLSIHLNEAIKHLERLEQQELVQRFSRDDKSYYRKIENEI